MAIAAKSATLRDLPPFPPVAAQLMRLLAQESPPLRELADLIRTDAIFSAQILRLANSAFFGLRHSVMDVLHALAVLGLTRVTSLVMTVAIRDFFLSAKQNEIVRRCWQHNLATALIAELLAEATWVDKASGYNAGLVHDVGLLALATQAPANYESLLACECTDVNLLRNQELELYGVDHCEAGRWLLEQWGFGEEFQQVAARHHDAAREGDFEITGLARNACHAASMAGFPVCFGQPAWDPEMLLSWLSEPARERFRARIEELPIEIATRVNLFDCDFLT